jgi:hypothetical protein
MAFCLWDGYTIAAWNFYLYHVPATAASPSAGRFVFLPHGADWPYWVSDLDPLAVDFRPWGQEFPAGSLAVRLSSGAFADRFRGAVVDVRDRAFDVDALGAVIDDVAAALAAADRGDAVVDAEVGAFDGSVDSARAFVVDRRAFLDTL